MKIRLLLTVVVALAVLSVGIVEAAQPEGKYTHKTTWQEDGQDAHLNLQLDLLSGGEAKLIVTGGGHLTKSRHVRRQHGEIVGHVIDSNKGRVAHSGTWSVRSDRVTVWLSHMRLGPNYSLEHSSVLTGTAYGDAVYINSFDRGLYGDENEMDFTRAGSGGGGSSHHGSHGTMQGILAGAALIGLAALLDHHHHDSGELPPGNAVRRDIEAWLDRFGGELEDHDWRALEQSLTGDFQYFDIHGGGLSRDQFVVRVRHRESAVSQTSVRVNLKNVTATSKQATGVADVTTSGRIMLADGRTHDLSVDESVRMHWIKQGSGWMLQTARSLDVTQKIDDNVVYATDW